MSTLDHHGKCDGGRSGRPHLAQARDPAGPLGWVGEQPLDQLTQLAGQRNIASGSAGSVSGGYGNTASANFASVSGGEGNTASGDCQAIPAAPITAC